MTRGTGWRIMVLALLATAGVAATAMLVAPATAQWFDDRFPGQRQRSWFAPWGQPAGPAEPPKPVDYSRAPAPKKSDVVPQTHVVVMGDAMADWLAYGLETAAAESPDIGITRKHKTVSGLIRTEVKHDPHGNHPDWPQAAREILAAEPANFVVFMVGLNDRKNIRESAVVRRPATAPPAEPSKEAKPAPPAKPGEPGHDDAEQSPSDAPAIIAEPEPARPAGSLANHEFRSEKWVELYNKRIDDTIAALKSRNVPVFWVGLPPIRGTRSSSDAGFLNDLYRSRAEKAGITYIDVWDGFVDEAGRFVSFGPDFEGQRRRLRSDDGVYFTKAGARKLAHYVEREVQRAMVTRATPVALPLPDEPTTPQASARSAPGAAARPLAGPVMPLTAAARDTDELLGAGAPRQSINDAMASRVLVKGEAVTAPAGRSDDFVWPRRGVAPVGADPVVATTTVPMTPMQPEKPVAVATAPAGEAARARPAAAPAPGTATAARPRPPGQQQAQRDPRRAQPEQRPAFYFPFFSRW